MKGKFSLKIKVPYEILEQLILIKGEKTLENFIVEILQEKILSEKNKSKKSVGEKEQWEKTVGEKDHWGKIEIKTVAEVLEKKQAQEQVQGAPATATVAAPGPAKEEKKEEKPISEELYEVMYEGKKNVVAEYKSFDDRTELYPVIPVPNKLWHNFLAKQADRLGIKAEASEEDGFITKMVFYKKEGVSEKDKQMFKQSVDWVFRTALKNIPK